MIVAVIRDITRYKTAEKALQIQAAYLKLLQDVAIAAYEASTIETAMQFAVDAVCNFTGGRWAMSSCARQAREFELYRIWHLSDTDRFEAFRQASERGDFWPDLACRGRSWENRKPEWWDITDPAIRFPRSGIARKAGLKSAFAFPVLV